MRIEFKKIWDNLSSDKNSIVERKTIITDHGLNIHLGSIGPTNSLMFQLELDKTIDIEKSYLKRFHGVEIRVIESSNIGKKDLTVILSDYDLIDVFVMFLEDLIQDIECLEEERNIPFVLNTKVNYWCRLFARISGEYLSKERQRGLYGELFILNDLLKLTSDHLNCISSWTGPEGSNQDFSNDSTALEVKTTKATTPSVNISNELQLDWTVLSNLYLAVIHVDEINNGSETLEKLIVQIKGRINNLPNLFMLFDDKLDRAGIPLGEETNYNKIGYVIRSKKFYRIQDGFPVLINSTINEPAIHNVKYQIDVSSIEDFETDFETIKKDFI